MDGSYKTMTRWPASEDFRIRCRIFMAPPPCVPPANGKSPGRASGAQMEFLVDFGWELHGSYPTEICRNGDLGWFKPQIWGYHWFQWIERRSIVLGSTSNIGGSCRFSLTPILGGEGFHQKNEMHNCVYYIYNINMCVYINIHVWSLPDWMQRKGMPSPPRKTWKRLPVFHDTRGWSLPPSPIGLPRVSPPRATIDPVQPLIFTLCVVERRRSQKLRWNTNHIIPPLLAQNENRRWSLHIISLYKKLYSILWHWTYAETLWWQVAANVFS